MSDPKEIIDPKMKFPKSVLSNRKQIVTSEMAKSVKFSLSNEELVQSSKQDFVSDTMKTVSSALLSTSGFNKPHKQKADGTKIAGKKSEEHQKTLNNEIKSRPQSSPSTKPKK